MQTFERSRWTGWTRVYVDARGSPEAVAAAFEFLVHIVQQQIGQQRRQSYRVRLYREQT
jgi:hypothetical protein